MYDSGYQCGSAMGPQKAELDGKLPSLLESSQILFSAQIVYGLGLDLVIETQAARYLAWEIDSKFPYSLSYLFSLRKCIIFKSD